jgi:adenylosuccinate lyase
MQDLVLDLRDLDHRIATLPLRGVKGTTGTQATFLDLFDGDHSKVRELDRLVTAKMDFPSSLPVTGQTYTRKIDASILSILSGLAASAAKFSGDVRMLQSFGEVEEPFEDEQVGSSAMAYKRNPMRSERIAGLARFVLSLEPNANQTHSVQFFERTLDDSSNRRLVIPESFLATEAILLVMANISSGLEVRTSRIAQRVRAELPFMATERLIVRAVRAGADRQEAHEIIRRHSVASSNAIHDGAASNDLLDRLAEDGGLGLSREDIEDAADPRAFIGRAPQQVEEFLSEVIAPLLAGSEAAAVEASEIRV